MSDLPPVAGILTAGAGNPLSHVQLLARNLGIPNVAVDPSLLPELRAHDGRRIVLAVSPAGLVEIHEDGPKWDAAFGPQQKAEQTVMFAPDLKKLDLKKRDLVSLETLRADDSGRTVGPKAAKLGELKSRFPDRVVAGVGIPFGLYRQAVLDKPYKQQRQDRLPVDGRELSQARGAAGRLEGSGSRQRDAARRDLRHRAQHRSGAAVPRAPARGDGTEFGADFKGGVFIRTDTNVEDLPGFTGAGLNLTLFNIVGFDNIVKGITEVWASPYTARAWAWRQSHMSGPEHVYPAVMLMRTVPSDVSGVMVTQDVDSGDRNVLSVAVNEGVGGAVDGQAAESVRIDRNSGSVRLMGSPPHRASWCRRPRAASRNSR